MKSAWKIKHDGCWVCEQTGRDDCQKCGGCPHPVEKTCFNCYYEQECQLQEVTVDEVQR